MTASADRVPVLVPAGASMARLLCAVEQLLVSLAEAETAGPDDERGRRRLPAPLAGRRALAALYRVWDGLAEQLSPRLLATPTVLADSTEPARGWVARRDLQLLTTAATALEAALTTPTPPAAPLGELLRARHADPTALARLLALLRPTDQASHPL